MSEMRINTRVRKLFHYLEDFERGKIRIPVFQRDFEWEKKHKIALLDSIKKGYPIGCLFFWRPDRKLENPINEDEEIYQIGAYELPREEEEHFYILDGYQRLSTLFGCLVNPDTTLLKRIEEEWRKEFNLVYDLKNDKIESLDKDNDDIYKIPFYELAGGESFFDFQERLIQEKISKEEVSLYNRRYRDFSKKLFAYDIPSIELTGGELREAIDVFIRLNSTGIKIDDDWILSALTYNREQNFRYGTEITALANEVKQYGFNYPYIKKIAYQTVLGAFGTPYFDQKSKEVSRQLRELTSKPNFIENTRNALKGLYNAILFLNKELLVLEKKLLPYNGQLLFLTEFFREHQNINEEQCEQLKYWFWKTTYTNYFTENNLAGQRKAFYEFKKYIIIDKERAIYQSSKIDYFKTIEFPNKVNLGSARANALVLFMLNYQVAKLNIKKEGLKYSYYSLFTLPENTDKEKSFENMIYVVPKDYKVSKRKHKDLSHWLDSKEDHSAFFVTQEMKEAYRNGTSKEEILEMRRTLIMQEEKKKVKELGIMYTE